jgi:hypothetical protein
MVLVNGGIHTKATISLSMAGHNPGYRTQVARFPDDNLGIIALSNDDNGWFLMEAVKFRIADEILGLKKLDWNDR